jgi:septal ring factor EnvC (AmiA/AmiB activator)
MPSTAFSEEEQSLLETFDRELHRTVETLKVEKQKNSGLRRERQRLEKEIHEKNDKMTEMAMVYEK